MVCDGKPLSADQYSLLGVALGWSAPRAGCYKADVPGDDSHNAAQIQAGLRRRWLYLMPVVFVTYSLAYLGRSNFGFGAAAGLAKSLNITESRAAFLGSVFFLGYFLFQIPAAAYAIRKSATRLVFFALISWGIFSGLTGIIHNYWLLVLIGCCWASRRASSFPRC